MLYTLLIIVYVLVCFFLILVVLLQQGKGADVAAAFGGASTQASFGPRGTTTLMHKLTTGSFIAFVMLCIGLSVLTGRSRSVTAGAKAPAAVATPAPAEPAAPQPTEQQGTGQAPGQPTPAPQQ
jgi:preprotein translocase subunit SecG